MANLDAYAVGNVAWNAGFRGNGLVQAIAVSRAEDGSGDPTKDSLPNNDPWRSIDRGLWQINNHWHPEVTDAQAHDPQASANAAYRISGGGRDWTAWSTFKNGAYRAHLAEAQKVADTITGAGGTSGTGGSTAGAGTDSTGTSTSPDVPPGAVAAPLANEWQAPHTLDELRLSGAQFGAYLVGMVADTSTVDLTVDQISQIDILLEDTSYFLALNSGMASLNASAQWRDLNLVVAATTVQQGPAGPEIDLVLRANGAEAMHRDRGPNPPTAADSGPWALSPTEVMQARAQRHGLRFVGKGSAAGSVQRNTPSTTTPDLWESDWDMGKRLAAEQGFWAFEASGGYYFGPPSWLVNLLPTFKVGWQGSAGDEAYDSLDCPKCFRSQDTKVTGAEITVTLPRERGEQIRPGLTMLLSGIPTFEGAYLVTRVQWPFDRTAPVTVTALEPKDPTPTGGVTAGSTGQAGSGSAATQKGTASALDFVTFALRQAGKPYQLGGGHDPTASNPASFDCASLVAWCAAQVGLDPKPLGGTGTTVTTLVVACIDAKTLLLPAGNALSGGWFPLAELKAGVPAGLATRGALMFVGSGAANGWEHVAISLGDGHSTIQATHTGDLVRVIGQENDFVASGLVPGLNYGTSARTGGSWKAA